MSGTPWLSIVGVDEGGFGAIGDAARRLIARAELIVGGERHLAMLPEAGLDSGAERRCWESPLERTVSAILEKRGRDVAIIATGDPFCYGIGVTMAKHVPTEEMTVLPAPGAFALATARLGWSRAEVDCLTLHGRPLSLLESALAPGNRLLLLSNDGSTPAAVADFLLERGYGESRMVALSHLGGDDERAEEALAKDWNGRRVPDLNTVALDLASTPGSAVYPRVPGLPDDAFEHDGQMTKRDVRAMTLARLMPMRGHLLWDVGAGSGSISIEWMRAIPGYPGATARAIAIERKPERLARIARNAEALGTPGLRIVDGEAPKVLSELPPPDAIFVGGGASRPGLIELCWAALKPGGRMVANGVTLEAEARLIALRSELGGELTRIAVSRAEPVGPFIGWRPAMPVTQWSHVK